MIMGSFGRRDQFWFQISRPSPATGYAGKPPAAFLAKYNVGYLQMDHAKLPSPPDRDASFAAESDYGTMYNIIFGHSVAQMARCAALFSFADHLAHGSATAEKIAEAEGLDADATFRLMRAWAAFVLMTSDKNTCFSPRRYSTPFARTIRGLCAPWPLPKEAVAIGGRGASSVKLSRPGSPKQTRRSAPACGSTMLRPPARRRRKPSAKLWEG